MLHESFISIFFRVINFVVILGLAYYLYKRYFKNRIDDKMTQKEALLKGLEEQGYFLEGKAHDFEMQLKEQEVTGHLLKQKLQDWNEAVQQDHHKRDQEQYLYAAQANERVQEKNKILAQHALQKAVLPDVLEQTHNELKKQFSASSHSKKYVHDIIQRLQGN